jgi:hypothetical protein
MAEAITASKPNGKPPAGRVAWRMVARRLNAVRRARSLQSLVPEYGAANAAPADQQPLSPLAARAEVGARSPAALAAFPWLNDDSGIVPHFMALAARLHSVGPASTLLPAAVLKSPILVPLDGSLPVATAAASAPQQAQHQSVSRKAGRSPSVDAGSLFTQALAVWRALQRGPVVDPLPAQADSVSAADAPLDTPHPVTATIGMDDDCDPIPFRVSVGGRNVLDSEGDDDDEEPVLVLNTDPSGFTTVNTDPLPPLDNPQLVRAATHSLLRRNQSRLGGAADSPTLQHLAHLTGSTGGAGDTPPASEAGGAQSVASGQTRVGPGRTTSRGVKRLRRMATDRAVRILQRFARLVARRSHARHAHELALERTVAERAHIVAAKAAEEQRRLDGIAAAERELVRIDEAGQLVLHSAALTMQRWWRRVAACRPSRLAAYRLEGRRTMDRAARAISQWWRGLAGWRGSRHLCWWWLGLQRLHRAATVRRSITLGSCCSLLRAVSLGFLTRRRLGEARTVRSVHHRAAVLQKALWKKLARRELADVQLQRQQRRAGLFQAEIRARAAIHIQRAVRGHAARQRCKTLRLLARIDCRRTMARAVIILQRFARRIIASHRCEDALDDLQEWKRRQFTWELQHAAATKIASVMRMVGPRRRWMVHVATADQREEVARHARRRQSSKSRVRERLSELTDNYVAQLCEHGWDEDEFRAAGDVSHALLHRHIRRRRKRINPKSIPKIALPQPNGSEASEGPAVCPPPVAVRPISVDVDDDRDDIFDAGLRHEAAVESVLATCPLLLASLYYTCCLSEGRWHGARGLMPTADANESMAARLLANAGRQQSAAGNVSSTALHTTSYVLAPPTPRAALGHADAHNLATDASGSAATAAVPALLRASLHHSALMRPFQRWTMMQKLLRAAMDSGLKEACATATAFCSLADYYNTSPEELRSYGPKTLGDDVLYRACTGLGVENRSSVVDALAQNIHAFAEVDQVAFVLRDALRLPSRSLIGPFLLIRGLASLIDAHVPSKRLCAMAQDMLTWHYCDSPAWHEMASTQSGPQRPSGPASFGELCFAVGAVFTDTLVNDWIGGVQLPGIAAAAQLEWSRRFSTSGATPPRRTAPTVQHVSLDRLRAVASSDDDAKAIILVAVLGPFLRHVDTFVQSVTREAAAAAAAAAEEHEDSVPGWDATEAGTESETASGVRQDEREASAITDASVDTADDSVILPTWKGAP